MNKTTGPSSLHRGALCAALLALALHSQAQEAEREAVPAPNEPQLAAPADDTTPPVAPSQDDSPFDYQASEEISQDLSVSFPVDI